MNLLRGTAPLSSWLRAWRGGAVPAPAAPVAEALEPRILYAADLSPLLLAGLADPGGAADAAAVQQPLTLTPQHPVAAELVFVDMGLSDAQTLIDDLQAQADAGRPVTIVRIAADEDGLARISETLAGQHQLTAVHVLSHGSDGVIELGRARLDSSSLQARAGELAAWGNALADSADLLLYGCDVAARSDGQALIAGLAQLTGADVTASDDTTGASRLGGDWLLEASTGPVDTAVAIRAGAQAQWQATMSLLAHDSFASSGNLNGKGGGSGWAGTWSTTGSALQGVGMGLADPSGQLPVGDGSVQLNSSARLSTASVTRDLSSAVGADGTTTWISFLVQPDATGTADYLGLEFGSPSATVGFAGYNGSSFILGRAGALTSTAVSGITPQAGQTVLLVLKLEHQAGNDTLTLYVNPTPGRDAPEATYTASISLDLGSFTRIAISGGNGLGSNKAQLDEVRVGQRYADVAPSTANNAPVITSDGGGATADIRVAENSVAATTVVATDADAGNTVSYSIVGGDDAARFSIDGSSGALRFVAAPDAEAPGDADANNVYSVVVQASDGSLASQQKLAVTVTNVAEAPVARDDSASTPAGTPLVLHVLANDSASDGGVLTLLDASTPAHGTASVSGSGVVYTPVAGYVGSDSLRYRVSDGSEGLLHYWAFQGDARDALGTASGSLVGGTGTVAGVYGDALSFDGVDDHAVLSDVSYTDEFSLSVWFRISDNDGTGYRYLYAHGDPGARNSVNVYFIEKSTSTGSGVKDVLRTSIVDGNDSVSLADLDVPAAALADGQWHLYTVTTRTGSGSVVFIDGVQRASSGNGGDAINPVGSVIVGGNSTLSAARYYRGALDTLQLHDHALSASEIAALKSGGGYTDAAVSLTMTSLSNSAPVITSFGGAASVAWNQAENLGAVTTVTASDADGNTLRYSLVAGDDAALFTVDEATGALRFQAAPDHEAPVDADANNVYRVTVQASDGALTATQVLDITITNVNEAPEIHSQGGGASASLSVAEQQTAVTTVTAADVDGDVPVFSIVGGADAALFQINASTGVLSFRDPPRFKTPGDSGADNVYDVVVRASDGSLGDDQALAVRVTNINDAPVITSFGGAGAATLSVDENQTTVVSLSASDDDAGSTLRWSITGGADGDRFAIDALTGALSLLDAPDHEAPADAGADNVYDVQVQVSDGSLSDSLDLSVTVADVNEAPRITSGGGGPTVALTVDENTGAGTPLAIVTATDVDAGATLRWSIVGGADGDRFAIDALTGALSLRVTPDHEAPVDAGADNVYDVQVQVSDGSLSDNLDLSVTVADVNEAPCITSGGGGPTAALTVAENTAAGAVLATLTATDVDAAATLHWSIVGGADGDRFAIDAASGVLSLRFMPDHEAPVDAGADNVYDVQVQVSDGSLSDSLSLSIGVANVNEAPALLVNRLDIREGGVATPVIVASDVDTPTAAWVYTASAVSGGHFELGTAPGVAVTRFVQADLDSGQLRFVHDGAEAAPTYRLSLSDGSLDSGTLDGAVNFTPVNDAPVTRPVDLGVMPEDGSRVITAADLLVGATDAEGDGLQVEGLTLTAGAGSLTDLGGGRWRFDAAPDWQGEVVFTFQVDDGEFAPAGEARLGVVPVNDAPRIVSGDGAAAIVVSRPENELDVTQVRGSDVDATDTLRYAIAGGADAAAFRIDPVSGALRFVAAPDRERPGDADGDNRYDLVVSVSDGALSATQAVTVVVDNVDEAPSILRNALVLSHGGVTLVLASSDPDSPSDQLTYRADQVVGGHFERVDAAGTAISSFTQAEVDRGAVRFALDDSGARPAYRLQLSDAVSTVASAAPTVVIETDPAVVPVVTEPDSPVATPSPAPSPGQATDTETPSGTTPAESTAAPAVAPAGATELMPSSPAGLPELSITPAAPVGARAALPGVATASSAGLPSVRAAEAEAVSGWLGSLLSPTDGPAGLAATVQATPLESALRDTRLEQALNQWRDDAATPDGLSRELAVSGAALSGGLSVGYVLWLARGGVLMASVMSALPAWAMLDPLPVLAQVKRDRRAGEDGDDDGDEVETLFDGAHGAATAPPADGPPSTPRADAAGPGSAPPPPINAPGDPTRTPA